jgi:hypothetical protein
MVKELKHFERVYDYCENIKIRVTNSSFDILKFEGEELKTVIPFPHHFVTKMEQVIDEANGAVILENLTIVFKDALNCLEIVYKLYGSYSSYTAFNSIIGLLYVNENNIESLITKQTP